MMSSAGEQGKTFPQPDVWLPERFLPGGPNADFGVTIGVNPKPGDVVPFSMGGRRYVTCSTEAWPWGVGVMAPSR